ncbi:MAG: radical SAM protein [Candidatus Adiutrix sp.]|nr:radical SAM protein [Candidatus Adiutrix sp.]
MPKPDKFPHAGSGGVSRLVSDRFQYAGSRGVSRLISDRLDPNAILEAEIGPAYREYRRRWNLARTFAEDPPFPLHVDYEMKFACNLRCPMCLMSLPPEKRAGYGQAGAELGAQTVADLIDEGAASGQMAMGFGGLWEPLLSPHLPELVERARRKGLVDVMFNTNGLLLTEKTGLELIRGGLTRLMISLDADTRATYDKMRVGSDFETVCANIKNFLKLRKKLNSRLPLVRLSFCLTALNEHELDAFMNRWREEVDFFSIQSYGRYDGAAPPGFPAQNRQPAPAGRCAQPHKRLLVRHNGQVLPCCDASAAAGLTVGRLQEERLADIWRGRPLTELRQSLKNEDYSGPAALCLACREKFQPPFTF